MKRVHIDYIGFDHDLNTGVILLSDPTSGKVLAVTVGLWEVLSLVYDLQHRSSPTPDTYELVQNLVESLDARISMMVIDDWWKGGCRARLILLHEQRSIVVDVNPCNAVALAIRLGFPIYVQADIWATHAVRSVEFRELTTISGDPTLKEWLAKIKPEDFNSL